MARINETSGDAASLKEKYESERTLRLELEEKERLANEALAMMVGIWLVRGHARFHIALSPLPHPVFHCPLLPSVVFVLARSESVC